MNARNEIQPVCSRLKGPWPDRNSGSTREGDALQPRVLATNGTGLIGTRQNGHTACIAGGSAPGHTARRRNLPASLQLACLVLSADTDISILQQAKAEYEKPE